MAMGRGSWVMWVMGQLYDGSHGSWVTKHDPFPSLSHNNVRRTYKRVSGAEVEDGLDVVGVDVVVIILLYLHCNTCSTL